MDSLHCEGDMMKRYKQSLNHNVSIAVILVVLLTFTPLLMAATVNIDINTANQTISGFGGMNFPRWIGTLTDAQVDTAFGNGSGQMGFTVMRIDIPPDSSAWSGEISAAVRAKSHGAIIFASPWSPPASMKSEGSTDGGYLLPSSYGTYATYLSDFADYMSSNGASLYAISLQNEADFLPDPLYESCLWTPSDMRTFLDNNASVIPVRVIAPETVHPKSDWYDALYSAPELDIYADHLYGGSPTTFGKEHWMTEHLDTNTDWASVLATGKEIHDCMANNYSAYIWWYIRRYYGPMDEDGSITQRGYVMSQYSKFIRPGYIRIDATENPSTGVYVTAYKSGNTIVIVAVNQNSSSSDVTFSVSGGTVNSYTKYQTTSDSNLADMGSVGSTNTLAASSVTTFAGTFDDGDTTAPEPDPMEWAVGGEPNATGPSSITMTAAAATDDIPPVEYYFECTTDGDANSTWQTNTTYVAQGLDPDTEYTFRVKARDSSAAQNETQFSGTASATTYPPDTTPPSPDPMEWAIGGEPNALGSSSITMTAATATDAVSPPVEYYFECTTDGDANSTWQASPTYIAQGLNPLTQYTFRVKARDSAPALNETAFSGTASATTGQPPTNVEILGNWATGTTHTAESGYSRALIFIAHSEDDTAITLNSVTYGDQPMTKVIEEVVGTSYRAYVTAFILDEAGIAAATSNTFVPTWSTTPDDSGYASVFLGSVNQTDPIGDSDGNSSASSTPNPITTGALSTEDGDMVFVGATCGNTGDYTVNSGFTEAIENDMSSSTGTNGYKSATGADETPSVTHSSVNRQVIIGFVVQSVPSAVDYPPAAPTGLVATPGNDLVSLDWNDNGEGDLAGYNVYRSMTQGSGYSQINGSLVVDSDYVDNTANNFTAYYYVVTAVDANDNESGYSNEDTATPDLYQNCTEVQAGGDGLVSDLTGDCYVNLEDLNIVSTHWLDTDCGSSGNCGGADFEPVDGDVDFEDFSDFAMDWMTCNDPGDSGCIKNWWP
jgi:glucuronoarabinoxylan endo-1,4-beta-xylanase